MLVYITAIASKDYPIFAVLQPLQFQVGTAVKACICMLISNHTHLFSFDQLSGPLIIHSTKFAADTCYSKAISVC